MNHAFCGRIRVMNHPVNMKRVIVATTEEAVERVTAALKSQGFGVLTRIDLHSKIEEKLGKKLKPVVILGACNPQLAYEAYQRDTNVASLLPCNAVIRSLDGNEVSIELARPTAMMEMLQNQELVALAEVADRSLEAALAQV